MRKGHWFCLLLGMMLGVGIGFGLVIAQLKYGTGPVVAPATVLTPNEMASCLEEPKPLAEGPFAPHGEADTQTERLEQTQRRLLRHLLTHAQTADEPIPPPTASTEAVAELLPMPRVEEVDAPAGLVAAPSSAPAPQPTIAFPALPSAPVPPLPRGFAVPPPASLGLLPAPLPVPFTGTYPCTLSEHGELTLPAQVHELMDCPRPRGLFVGLGEDNCVLVFTLAGAQQQALQFAGWPEDARARRDIRRACSRLQPVEVSVEGRLQLPEELIRLAGLSSNVVLIGVRDHYEIWDAQQWQHYLLEAPMPAAVEHPTEADGQGGQDATEIEWGDDGI